MYCFDKAKESELLQKAALNIRKTILNIKGPMAAPVGMVNF